MSPTSKMGADEHNGKDIQNHVSTKNNKEHEKMRTETQSEEKRERHQSKLDKENDTKKERAQTREEERRHHRRDQQHDTEVSQRRERTDSRNGIDKKGQKVGDSNRDEDGRRRKKQRREDERRKRRPSSSLSRHKKISSSRHKRSSRGRTSKSDRDRRDHKKSSKRKRRRRRDSSSESSSGSSSDDSSSTDSSSSSSSDSSDRSNRRRRQQKKVVVETKKIINQKLIQKLAARGETLEEREERRSQRRAARIASQFGYTAEENPFNDPNLAETFSWKKKEERQQQQHSQSQTQNNGPTVATISSRKSKQEKAFAEIEKVRIRRSEYEAHREEMERIRAEESRMKELENYDDWAKKEEEFHLQQQRQRSAIRLVEGRERPIDVLAKNLLLFGLSDGEKNNRATVKYKEKYNALDELETLEAELEEPHLFLKDLKLTELEELLVDVEEFRTLEAEAIAAISNSEKGHIENTTSTVLRYWEALRIVLLDEIRSLKNDENIKSEGGPGNEKSIMDDISKLFEGQTVAALEKMRQDINDRLDTAPSGKKFSNHPNDADSTAFVDVNYWKTVLNQLHVHLAKMDLSDIHSKMLVCQLEKLEKRKDELGKASTVLGERESRSPNQSKLEYDDSNNVGNDDESNLNHTIASVSGTAPDGMDLNFGNLEEELGLTNEVELEGVMAYAWQEKYRPRKPRYFNRVKTGYDWNKYNQTHYDHDNPPPKTVQGYKFNIFYPDLIDRMCTPKYVLEPADSREFCIIRFSAGPPYEDVAFKIINREWNRSRKRGFRCTFERGVLSLYFNFASHWYRR